MKAVWKGDISFGLVNIPVSLYSVSEPSPIKFHLIHKKDGARIRYKRWCDKDKVEVKWNDVVRGLEIGKDKYFILTDEELEKLKPEKTSSIDIKAFTDKSKIDHIYFSDLYFIAPQREKEKAYFLFKEALIQTASVAIGMLVMHEKEHLCIIESYKNGLLMTLLNFTYEVRNMDSIETLKAVPKTTSEETKLANELVQRATVKSPDLGEYRETFTEELKQLIKRKLAGEKVEIKPKAKPKLTLMEALKASVKK